MAREKILITVKTYPTLSKKYSELVCTAGFREDGSWIRLYPIQFRRMPYQEQFKKWHWVEMDIVKNTKDFRPESYRPVSLDTQVEIIGEIKADGDAWSERRKIALKTVYTNKKQLIDDAKNRDKITSLATFKPQKILKFITEPVEREWDKNKLEALTQMNLFETEQFKVVRKLPYKFSYRFTDDENAESKLMIEDWEIGQLYWNSLKRHNGDESKACEDVKKKYFDDFAKKKDLFLFLGTTKVNHFTGRNPFVIIGLFYPKPISQMKLF